MQLKRKNVYLSGKVSGLPLRVAKRKFDEAQKYFNNKGIICCNPCRQFLLSTWEDNLIRDLMLIKQCDTVCFIDGWETSTGANIEKQFAEKIGKEIIYFENGELITEFNNYISK